MHCHTSDIQLVLILHENLTISKKYSAFLREEFDENLSFLTLDMLYFGKKKEKKTSEIAKEFNYHVIDIKEDGLEVLFLDNSKENVKLASNIEISLEEAARKIIAWYHKQS